MMWRAWVLWATLCLSLFSTHAADTPNENQDGAFSIRNAQTHIFNKTYMLDARMDLRLGAGVEEALNRGLALTLIYDIEILQEREYLWDETIATLTQRYQISYNALTEQYSVLNLNTGLKNNFPTVRIALEVLGTLTGYPLIDRRALDQDESYRGQIRARLDLESLPVPVRLQAYVSPSWWLSSEWYSWSLTHSGE